MTGQDLKARFKKLGVTQADIAKQLGITTPSVAAWFKYQNVSTKILEDLCDILDLKINDFYLDTKYAMPIGCNNVGEPNNNEGTIPAKTFDNLYHDYQKMLQERDEYKDLAAKLKSQISDMQRGMTIPEIAQKEAG